MAFFLFLLLPSCGPKRPPTVPREAVFKTPPVTVQEKEERALTPQRQASEDFVSKGIRHLEQEEHDRANYAFQQAIHIDASNESAYYYLALIKYLEGDSKASLNLLERVEALAKGDKEWVEKVEELREAVRNPEDNRF